MNYSNSKEKFDDYWIGEIPEHWKPSRIKNIVSFSPDFSDGSPVNEEKYTIVPMEAVGVTGEIDNKNKGSFENISTGLTHFENGDVLFAKITPCMENGKGAYVNNIETKYGFGSTEFHVLRPTHQVDGIFLYFYTFNTQYRDYAALNMTGAAGQKRVSSKFLAYTRIYLPDIKQQKKISVFLKETCSTINTTIKIKQKQLETLEALKKSIIHKAVTQGLDDSVEMKDSWVAWLGEMPKQWRLKKLKYLVEVKDGTHDTPSYENNADDSYPFVTSKDIIDNEIDFSRTKFISKKYHDRFIRRSNVTLGDIIMPMIGTLGNAAIIKTTKEFSIKNVALFKTSTSKDMITKYVFYFIESEINKKQFKIISKGGVQSFLSLSTLRNLYIPTPTIQEQKNITNYLDQKTTQIENLKKNILKQIETLEQYRKSIVHECVTGKRRITENDIKEH